MLELEMLKKISYEIGPIRPPSEGRHSLLLRLTRNCPWGLCKFCYGKPYNRERFKIRGIQEIEREIENVKTLKDGIETISKKLGGMEWTALALSSYSLYGKEVSELNLGEFLNFQCIMNVFSWIRDGARTVFLQDADNLMMRTDDLVEILRFFKRTLGAPERVTSYARGKTVFKKPMSELKEIKKAGLSRLHVGLESGDELVLKYMNKGMTPQELIVGGKKAIEAGFELSLYVILGLGGKSMWRRHAENTAKVLNEINPDFVRVRRLVPLKDTPLFEEWKRGEFILLSPHEELKEIATLIKGLEFEGKVCFDHFANPFYHTGAGFRWVFKQDSEGYQFPQEKEEVLRRIEKALEINESNFIAAGDLSTLETL